VRLVFRPHVCTIIGRGRRMRFFGKPVGNDLQRALDRAEGRES
jgi:hypothetical protein